MDKLYNELSGNDPDMVLQRGGGPSTIIDMGIYNNKSKSKLAVVAGGGLVFENKKTKKKVPLKKILLEITDI